MLPLAKVPKLEVPVSYAMMEGYIAGGVIVEAARRMGAKVSREGFVAGLDSIGNLDLELTIITATGSIRQ